LLRSGCATAGTVSPTRAGDGSGPGAKRQAEPGSGVHAGVIVADDYTAVKPPGVAAPAG